MLNKYIRHTTADVYYETHEIPNKIIIYRKQKKMVLLTTWVMYIVNFFMKKNSKQNNLYIIRQDSHKFRSINCYTFFINALLLMFK